MFELKEGAARVCVAAIGEVIEINGTMAKCSFRGAIKEASVVLVPKVKVGSFVVVHAGFATEIVKDLTGYYRNTVATDAYSRQLLDAIESKVSGLGRNFKIMNFCGSHEHTISRFGLRELLPLGVELISGPGCPVCVTPVEEIYLAMEVCKRNDVILTVYGDMLNIPTPWGSLHSLKSEGAKISVISDINQSLDLARQVKEDVVHFAVGFETTAPSTAVAIREADNLENFSIISSHRVTEPAMDYVLSNSKIDAILCPGNVAAITGTKPYEELLPKYKIPLVVTGFEPVDVLEAVLMTVTQFANDKLAVENQYASVVTPEGNQKAQEVMEEVFRLEDASWRGLPVLPQSRMVLRDKYQKFNAERKFGLQPLTDIPEHDESCCCGEIIRGAKEPKDCPNFGRDCCPDDPKGPCMITAEGACRIRYGG